MFVIHTLQDAVQHPNKEFSKNHEFFPLRMLITEKQEMK